MKKLFKVGVYLVVTIAITAIIYSCGKEDDESSTANFNVKLTDAPADYDAVNIDIQEILIHYSDVENDTAEWTSLENMNTGIYNLLEFSNGIDTALANSKIPTGTLSQIRLVLGDNNTLVIDGITYDLETPAAQQSGLKLNFHTQIEAGITYTVWLDFDASKSIVVMGNGKYNLKPVIRAFTEAQDGGIRGTVSPAESQPVVMAIINEDTVSTYSDEFGNFFLMGLNEGTYNVLFSPVEGYEEKLIENIQVELGVVTDMDTVFMD